MIYDVTDMTQRELGVLVRAGALAPTGRTRDGRVTSYRITHLGEMLLTRCR